MIPRLFGPFVVGRPALGLLFIRLVFGLALVFHGLSKIQNPFHWMDRMPAPAPGILQGLAALSEFGGGLALIVGLLTPLACLGILSTMIVAFVKVHLPAGNAFVANGAASFETVAFFAVIALALIIAGPGALSLDALLFGRRTERYSR